MTYIRNALRIGFYLAIVPAELLVLVAFIEWYARRKRACVYARLDRYAELARNPI